MDRDALLVVLGAAALIFIAKGKFKKPANQKGFVWWTTGIMIGLISVAALYSSEVFGGFATARGISFSGPYNELVAWFTSSSSLNELKTAAGEADLGTLAKVGTVTWSLLVTLAMSLL